MHYAELCRHQSSKQGCWQALNCPYTHTEVLWKPCKFLIKFGDCKLGDGCPFRHWGNLNLWDQGETTQEPKQEQKQKWRPKGRGRKRQTGVKGPQVDGRTTTTPDLTSPPGQRGRPRSTSSEESKAPGREASGRSSHEPNGAEVVVKEEPMEEENHTELAAGPVVLAVATAEEARGAKDSVGTFLMPPPPPPPTAPDQRTTSMSSAAVLQGEQETVPEGVEHPAPDVV